MKTAIYIIVFMVLVFTSFVGLWFSNKKKSLPVRTHEMYCSRCVVYAILALWFYLATWGGQ